MSVLFVYIGCVRVCFAVAVSVTANVDIQIVTLQLLHTFLDTLNCFLQTRFVVAFSLDEDSIPRLLPCIQPLSELL